MSDSFLVYDGRNNLFRAGAKQVARLSGDIRLIPWRAEPTREFLEAQFGDHLFVFALIEPEADRIHVGKRTVRRLLRNSGAPWLLVEAAERAYGAVGDSFGRVVHKQAPADIDGTFPLTEDAQPHVETLRRECSLAACAPSSAGEQ